MVDIRGREYRTVALRVGLFRKDYPIDDGWFINTWIEALTDEHVLIKAMVGHHAADGSHSITLATGYAYERFDDPTSKINRTSGVENCETSAIGRALAAAGYGGDEYCSADELVRALEQQKRIEKAEKSAGMKPGVVDTSKMNAKELEAAFDESIARDHEAVNPDDWDERDLLEMIKTEANRGVRVLGEPVYRQWHESALLNRWNVRTLSALSKLGKDKLAFFLKAQRERIRIAEEENNG